MELDRAKIEAVLVEIDRPSAWVAKRLGIHRATFHHYVRGERQLPAPLYPKLVAILGTTDILASDVTSRLRPAESVGKVAA